MYKLTRLWELSVTDKTFETRGVPREALCFNGATEDTMTVAALYEASEKYRLVDEYGPYSFTPSEDGRLYCELGFRSEKSALRWFLSFGSGVEILSPEPFRQTFNNELRRTLKIYENT